MDLVVPDTVYGPRGEVLLIPDLDTFKILPYAEGSAAMIVDQFDDDKPHEVDPRPRLKENLRNIKFSFKIGFEPEFYIFRKNASGGVEFFDTHLCFQTHGIQVATPLLLEIEKSLDSQGISIEHYYPEYGPAQHELSLKPYPALQAADNLIYFRETLRGVLAKYGLFASFMPKPFDNLPGTGLHTHISVWNGEENVLYSEKDRYKLSEAGYHFIGGILKHMDALLAFTAASVNSYKRLRPSLWASAFAIWGPENREAAVRIPKLINGKEKETLRLELKCVDATSNPYLAVGSIIAAGLDGIERKIEPPDPCLENPAIYSQEEREAKNWRRYPEYLIDAIRNLDKSTLFREFWGDRLITEYVKLKKYQFEYYYLQVIDWERKTFLNLF
ncbi:MAG TPA: hypothetical protein VKU94_01350, partial [Geobacterales bacterium]|nr:hypothetical protein [Geobacterales bacterium]